MMGNGDSGAMELVALDLLDRTEGPVGSARLAEALRRDGIGVAEVTAGRLLRQLDERGLSRILKPTKGRVITEEGRQRLQELRRTRSQYERGARVLRAINGSEIEDLTDFLYVRLAVETEAARSAAIRATREEIDRLAAFAATHVHQAAQGASTSDPSMGFHRMVVEASHNHLLIAVGLLLLDSANDPLEKLLEEISLEDGVTLEHVGDHVMIGEALRERNPKASEAAMRTHIERMIRTVEAWRDRTMERRKAT